MESVGGVEILPISTAPVPNDKLVIHKSQLYGTMVPFNKDASLLSNSSAIMLNNYQYNLKLACSIVPVSDRQFVMRRGIVKDLNELLDLNLKVSVTIEYFIEV